MRPPALTPDQADAQKRAIIAELDRRLRITPPDQTPAPVRALELARIAGVRIGGSDDSRKRGVRELISAMQADGLPVVSDPQGYLIGQTPADFARHERFLARMARTQLAHAGRVRRSEAAADAAGQLSMFADAVVNSVRTDLMPGRRALKRPSRGARNARGARM